MSTSSAQAIAHLQGELDALAAANGPLPGELSGLAFLMEFTTANQGAPYNFGDVFDFSFSVSGRLGVDFDPMAADGDEIVMPAFTEVGGEVTNFYMVPGNTSVLQSVRFRHRSAAIDAQVDVGSN